MDTESIIQLADDINRCVEVQTSSFVAEIDKFKADVQKWRDKCSLDHEAACLRATDELEEKVKLQAEIDALEAEREQTRR